MNIVDIVIILFLITALIRGTEIGLVRQLCSTIALVGGLFLSAFIQGKYIYLAQTPTSKALFVLTVVLVVIGIFSSVGDYLGSLLKVRLENTRWRALNTLDKATGSVIAATTLLLVVWLGAAIFTNTPSLGLQRQIKGSFIVSTLDKALPAAPNVIAKLGHLINPNGFPNVFTGLEPNVNTNKPLPSIGDLDSAVQATRASVVKVMGEGCGGISEGSGFVAADGVVITNAHVVAGVAQPYIVDGAGKHRAQVVSFDKDLDLAVLRATNLAGAPLTMSSALEPNGTAGAIEGYPGGGDFTAKPGLVLESFNAQGRDIYNQGSTLREVYSVKGEVIPGNSGGPLVDKDGKVIGVIFAKSTAYDSVGYALTMQQVVAEFNQVKSNTASVGTGACAE
jgi:S1-C subfamily serine protease